LSKGNGVIYSLIDAVLPEIKSNIHINIRNAEYQKIQDAASVLDIAYLKLARKMFWTNSPKAMMIRYGHIL